MGAVADHCAKVRQDGVVQQRDIADHNQRAQEQDAQRHGQNLKPVGGEERSGAGVGQLVHQPPDIPDQRHIGEGGQHRQGRGGGKDLAEGADILGQKRPQLARGRVRRGVGGVGVNQVFEKAEHRGAYSG